MKIYIQTPKWSFIKYKDDGSIDYISPIPCPFNYGYLPDLPKAQDGDFNDAILVGEKRKGTVHSFNYYGVVVFTDNGVLDNKHIYGVPTPWELFKISAFFKFYGSAKRVLNLLRVKKGKTRYSCIMKHTELLDK